jgi:hypothetical protein
MDFLKKHYEKVLLGVVLVGLALAVAFLPFKISSDKQTLEEATAKRITKTVKPLTNLDLTFPEDTLKRMATPASLDLSSGNRLFNPVPWQQAADKHLIKVESGNIGPLAVIITKLTPLWTTFSLDKVVVLDSGAAEKGKTNEVKYVVGVKKEAAPEGKREKKQSYVKLNDKNESFALREVKGPADESAQLILELSDTGEKAVVTTNQPFRRIDGWMADLKYDPETKTWSKRRVGSQLVFNGEDYNIVAISSNEVVLSAKSNQKKWTVKQNPTP